MNNSKYQEALDYIVKNSCNKRVACNECDIQNICNSSAKSRVDNLQELIDKTTWIPVKERLPKDERRVLVQLSNEWQQVAWHDGIEWILLCDEAEPIENHYIKVIAWMPLPKPYLGSDENDR